MYRLTSIKTVIDKILRDNLFDGLTFETAVDYFLDFIRIVGVPTSFENKFATIDFDDYRTTLPCDFVEIKQLLINGVPARYATDTFHNNYAEMDNLPKNPGYTFKIENEYIYLSKKTGTIQISYLAIPMLDGFPAIPDDAKFIRALRRYIEVEFLRILYRNKKIDRAIYEDAEQEYCFAVGAYETSSKIENLAQLESVFNLFSTLMMRTNEAATRYSNLGSKEQIITH